jgi:glycerophosphoryl diester phosphodiesterase
MSLDPTWPLPRWIAHRGAGKLAPENTLAAFRCGASHGYRAYECDVKLSRDGVPFLLHDAILERTTSGHGRAADRDWAELSQLDAGSWHGRAYAGEPPASLAAVAAHCLAHRHALNIEIKPTPGDEALTGEAVAQAAARLWQGHRPPVLSSFAPTALAAAQRAEPALPRALLLDRLADGWFDSVRALGCAAVVLHHPLVSEEVVRMLHGAGLKVLAYTVNDPAVAATLEGLGLDGLITDAIDRFAPD